MGDAAPLGAISAELAKTAKSGRAKKLGKKIFERFPTVHEVVSWCRNRFVLKKATASPGSESTYNYYT